MGLLGRATGCVLSNVEVLTYVLGWQWGTAQLVARELGTSPGRVMVAGREEMTQLCLVAQVARRLGASPGSDGVDRS